MKVQGGTSALSLVIVEKRSLKRLTGCWNATGGSSSGEPGISAAGQAGRESKLRFRRHDESCID